MTAPRRSSIVAGVIAGIGFAAKSLEPSLMRRSAVDQGLIMGGSFLTGFLAGSLTARIIGMIPLVRSTPAVRALGVAAASARSIKDLQGDRVAIDENEAWGEAAAGVLSATALSTISDEASPLGNLASGAAILASTSIDVQRSLEARSDHPDVAYLATATGVAAGLNAAVAGMFGTVYLGGRVASRLMPIRWLKPLASIAGATGVFAGITLALRAAASKALAKIAAGNRMIEVSYAEPPPHDAVSGSAVTLTPYATLGLQGRRLVSEYTRVESIETVMGEPARRPPVRVYVGLGSAQSEDARIELAIQEMRRAGGFDRSTIMAASPAGTGYVNYIAAEAIELMALGDVATVAVQYGEVPSMLSITKVDDAARVYAKLLTRLRTEIDQLGRNIRLVAYGESLGAITSQRGVLEASPQWDGCDTGTLVVDGALWVGTPQGSRLFADLVECGVPVFDHFSGVHARRESGEPDPQVFLLNHDNDPVARFNPRMALEMPGWLATTERGRGMDPNQRWFPGVAFWQGLIDTKNAATVIPGEFFSTGHDYRADLAEFIRAAYRYDDVNDEQMASIEERLRASEIRRAERIAQGKVDPATVGS